MKPMKTEARRPGGVHREEAGRYPAGAGVRVEADSAEPERCNGSSVTHEPPYTEPYVRWCGRTAGVTPPPTR
jgi:hypothetical protein